MTTRLSDIVDIHSNSIKNSWVPLSNKWKSFLLSNNFYVLESCESIECALYNSGYNTDHNKLRMAVARFIRKLPYNEFWKLIQSYRTSNNDTFSKYFKTKQDFIKLIKSSDFVFPGDKVTLHLLSSALQLDFILFTETQKELLVSRICNGDSTKVVLLLIKNDTNDYFNVGYQLKNNVKCLLPINKLPNDVLILLDNYEFLLKHIKHYTTSVTRLKLNDIFNYLQTIFNRTFSQDEKQQVIKIIQLLLQNQDFLNKINK